LWETTAVFGMTGWLLCYPTLDAENASKMGRPKDVVELTKSKSKNNRRSFDSFHARRETSLRMTTLWETTAMVRMTTEGGRVACD
jgi:hypothetical protein